MTRTRLRRLPLLLLPMLLLGCDEVLYQDLNQREANQIISVLEQAGIDAQRVAAEEKGIFSVTVAQADFAAAIALLEERGLPQKHFETMADVFSGDGMLSSPLQERARLAYALSQELTRSLTTIDGIIDARVHLTLARDKPLTNDVIPATASVLLTHRPDFDAKTIIPDVKFLVAKGVPNLSYRDVSVVTLPQKAWPMPKRQEVAERQLLMGTTLGNLGEWRAGASSTLIAALAVLVTSIAVVALLIRRAGCWLDTWWSRWPLGGRSIAEGSSEIESDR